MTTTNLKGIKAKHYIISDNCVEVKGEDGAIDFALEGIKKEFGFLYKNWKGKGAKFHVVITVEKPDIG